MDCVGTQRWLFMVAEHVGAVVGQLVADSAHQFPLGIIQTVQVVVVGIFWDRGDAVSESIWPFDLHIASIACVLDVACRMKTCQQAHRGNRHIEAKTYVAFIIGGFPEKPYRRCSLSFWV